MRRRSPAAMHGAAVAAAAVAPLSRRTTPHPWVACPARGVGRLPAGVRSELAARAAAGGVSIAGISGYVFSSA
eukprot:3218779-Lingulodinium_polyedra.AAC.1